MRNIRRKLSSNSLCRLEFLHLFCNLMILLIYTLQKRTHFLILYFFERVFQIQCIDRFDQILCLPSHQKEGQQQNQNQKYSKNGKTR